MTICKWQCVCINDNEWMTGNVMCPAFKYQIPKTCARCKKTWWNEGCMGIPEFQTKRNAGTHDAHSSRVCGSFLICLHFTLHATHCTRCCAVTLNIGRPILNVEPWSSHPYHIISYRRDHRATFKVFYPNCGIITVPKTHHTCFLYIIRHCIICVIWTALMGYSFQLHFHFPGGATEKIIRKGRRKDKQGKIAIARDLLSPSPSDRVFVLSVFVYFSSIWLCFGLGWWPAYAGP